MKKACFYSLHKGGKAILHEGYIDSNFWYYKHGRTWFAIYPETGTAAAIEPTRKAAAQKAHSRLESVAKFYTNHPEHVKTFNEACLKAIFGR